MFRARLSVTEQCLFFKRLSFLLGAGLPMLEALHILHEQATDKLQASMLKELRYDVSQGQSLSRGLAKRAGVFSPFSISIVKIGEQSGTLSSNLVYLANELRKKQELTRTIISASIYPALITVATLSITVFLLLFLFPKIIPIFGSMHVALPLSTRMVMATSSFIGRFGFLLVMAIVLASFVLTLLLQKSKQTHVLFDQMLVRIPVIGTVVIAYNTSNISRMLALLLQSGNTLSVAVTIAADATHNTVYKRELFLLAHSVERGDKISDFVNTRKTYFPSTMRHLVAVGERSGSLSETLFYIAESYDTEVREFTKRLSILIEPALMIIMGLLVGFIAISIITPLYGITQGLHV